MDLQINKSTSGQYQEDRGEKKTRDKKQFPPGKEKLLEYPTGILSDSESFESLEDAMILITVASCPTP